MDIKNKYGKVIKPLSAMDDWLSLIGTINTINVTPPSNWPNSATTAAQFSQDLEFLNKRINYLRRYLTFFDIYHIKDVVTDESTFDAKVSALPVNSSLVVNAKVQKGSEEYNRGDVVVKLNDGSVRHIRAQNVGIFYPVVKIAKDENNKDIPNTYSLNYIYTSQVPDSTLPDGKYDISNPEDVPDVNNLPGILQYNIPLASGEGGVTYGIYQDTENEKVENNVVISKKITFNVVNDSDGHSITPIFRLFVDEPDSNYREEYVSSNITLSLTDGKYTIGNIPSIVNKVLVK